MGCIVFSFCPKQGVHPFISDRGLVCTCQFFLSQMRGISVSSWLPGFRKQPKNFWQFSQYIWTLHKIFSKMFQLLFNTSTAPQLQYGAHVLSLKLKCNLKHNSFSMLWYTWDTKSTLRAFLEYFRDMELNLFYWSCVREKNRLEVWVRHKKLSLMRENDVFSPQACDSGIMCESWHV